MPIEYLHSSYAFLGIDPIPRCSRLPSLLHMHTVRFSSLRVWYIAVLSSINICPQDPRPFFLLSIYIRGCHTARLSCLLVVMYAQIKECKTRVCLHKSCCSCIQSYGAGHPTLWGQMLSIQNKDSFHPALLSRICEHERNRQTVLERRGRGKERTHIQHGPHRRGPFDFSGVLVEGGVDVVHRKVISAARRQGNHGYLQNQVGSSCRLRDQPKSFASRVCWYLHPDRNFGLDRPQFSDA